jgi:hypothetical protein
MKPAKRILFVMALVAAMAIFTGCVRPYDKPEFVTIEASQTAFLIPLVGDTTEQASFQSEELLANAMVATKEVQIPHRWVQTGRRDWSGEWRAAAKLIIVERTPETREWSSERTSGTSSKNQAIYAESSESIGFSVGMNCSAQIYTENDAVKFLYSYNNKTLEEIMDSEIRARVESKFVEECANFTLNEILSSKEKIMTAVREDVTTYFADKGITITVLGMKDGIEYDDPEIQKAINEKFSSEQLLTTQENNNKVIISKAEAEAKALLIATEAEAEANRKLAESLTPELINKQRLEKWNGVLPQIVSDSTVIKDFTQ